MAGVVRRARFADEMDEGIPQLFTFRQLPSGRWLLLDPDPEWEYDSDELVFE